MEQITLSIYQFYYLLLEHIYLAYHHHSLFLLSGALIGLGWGTIFPSLQTVAIEIAPVDKRTLATATYLSTAKKVYCWGDE
ncbi:hypothetical protein AA0X95_14245 [Bacillus sp. 1P10SD]|uniref:hypothetical protein n=1 Tax=Bacillus sp. 1P10SD TaxID=3132265 RepID=UPI0039A4DF36